MCTLMDKAEAMCHQTCLPNSWWEFATAHATHLYNRTLLSRLQWHTPYEELHSKLPRVDHLYIFGCTAYVFLPADVWADKLAPKSELMVYLCMAPGNKANYLFMCPPNNILFTRMQASFEEVLFPKCDRPRQSTRVPADLPAEPPLLKVPIPHGEDCVPPSHSTFLDSHLVTPPAVHALRQPPASRKQRAIPPAIPAAPR